MKNILAIYFILGVFFCTATGKPKFVEIIIQKSGRKKP